MVAFFIMVCYYNKAFVLLAFLKAQRKGQVHHFLGTTRISLHTSNV